MKMQVFTILGENCITLEDGQAIYAKIYPELTAKHSVELDFSGVKVLASPFFNAAIGQLLRDFAPDDLNQNLRIVGLSSSGVDTLRKVIENSREYYLSRKHQRAIDEAVESGEE